MLVVAEEEEVVVVGAGGPESQREEGAVEALQQQQLREDKEKNKQKKKQIRALLLRSKWGRAATLWRKHVTAIRNAGGRGRYPTACSAPGPARSWRSEL